MSLCVLKCSGGKKDVLLTDTQCNNKWLLSEALSNKWQNEKGASEMTVGHWKFLSARRLLSMFFVAVICSCCLTFFNKICLFLLLHCLVFGALGSTSLCLFMFLENLKAACLSMYLMYKTGRVNRFNSNLKTRDWGPVEACRGCCCSSRFSTSHCKYVGKAEAWRRRLCTVWRKLIEFTMWRLICGDKVKWSAARARVCVLGEGTMQKNENKECSLASGRRCVTSEQRDLKSTWYNSKPWVV